MDLSRLQIMQTTAGNPSRSGIRAERKGNAFNLSLCGDLVHSLVSQEASCSCCCHLLATSKICCIFIGLRTNPSFCGLSALGFEQTASDSSMSLAGGGLPGFSLRSFSCCVAEPSVPVVFQRDSDRGLSIGAVEPTFPLCSSILLPGVISTSTFSYGQVALQESWKVPFLAWASQNMPAVWEGGFCLSWAFANPFLLHFAPIL